MTESANLESVEREGSEKSPAKKRLINKILFLIGTISLIFGIVGIIFPILPTTPFLLITAALYAKSSTRFYNWLINNRVLGFYIKNYREGKGMPFKLKVITISLLWGTILITIFFFVHLFWIQLLLFGIAIGVTIHVIMISPKN